MAEQSDFALNSGGHYYHFEDLTMGRSKDDVIRATGGLFASPIEKEIRGRIYQLEQIKDKRALTSAELSELVSLIDRLPDDDEEDYRFLDRD